MPLNLFWTDLYRRMLKILTCYLKRDSFSFLFFFEARGFKKWSDLCIFIEYARALFSIDFCREILKIGSQLQLLLSLSYPNPIYIVGRTDSSTIFTKVHLWVEKQNAPKCIENSKVSTKHSWTDTAQLDLLYIRRSVGCKWWKSLYSRFKCKAHNCGYFSCATLQRI